jgi:16S rRNA (uracil1498-N3)-methyltransferase
MWAAAQDAAAHTFVDSLDDVVEVAGADGHHLQRVRRLRVGEHVTAADGRGSWRRYEIEAVASGRLRLAARGGSCAEPEIVPRVALAVALTKAGALDRVVARCTELGVARVTPVRTRRCVVQWDAAQAQRGVERLRGAAREAAAQSRRARLPEIEPVADLADLLAHPGLVVADREGVAVRALGLPNRALGLPNGALGLPNAELPGREWVVLVGPEGGLDGAELESLGRTPRLALGPHVLRAETAPVAAVALLVEFAREMCRE